MRSKSGMLENLKRRPRSICVLRAYTQLELDMSFFHYLQTIYKIFLKSGIFSASTMRRQGKADRKY